MPFTVFQAGNVIIMFTTKFDTEVREGNSIGFLSITLGFLNFPYQARLHVLPPQYNQKALR
jgi:hypothetical protein